MVVVVAEVVVVVSIVIVAIVFCSHASGSVVLVKYAVVVVRVL